MKWRYLLLALVALAIFIPAGLYFGSLDLRYSHRKSVV